MSTELTNIKDEIINKVVVLSAIFFAPTYVFSLLRWFEMGWQNIYVIHSVVFFGAILLAVFRKKINYNIKTIVISLLYLSVAIAGIIKFALNGGFYFVVIAIAILAILANRKVAMAMGIFMMTLFVAIGIGFITHNLEPIVDLNKLVYSPSHWALILTSIFSFTIIFIYGFGNVYQKLIHSIATKDATTAKLRVQKQLLETTETKYQMVFDGANDAIMIIKDGVLFDCNEMACEYFLIPKAQLLGKKVGDLSPTLQADGQVSKIKSEKILLQVLNNQSQEIEWQHVKSNGEPFTVSISLNKITLQGEDYIQGILRDITEKKAKDIELENYRGQLEKRVEEKTENLALANQELNVINDELLEKNTFINAQNEELKTTLKNLKETQAQLYQAEKMASLGVLTAGVAHEINNPLNFIMGAYEGLKANQENDSLSAKSKEVEFLINSLKTGIDRTSSIVQGLNQFSRSSKSYTEDCDINTIIENTLVILNNKLKGHVEVKKQLTPNSTILGNSGELHQVFINLFSNAADAIVENGNIFIKSVVNNGKLMVEIKDDGCGIEPFHMEKIMEPFFTTKPPGKGTGLGLSICYKIMDNHNGTLEFESEINIGTTARLIFNLNEK
tara:strand:+ start:6197 stop:8044 length:1848 start_codon:yes stop_codon:yes gene_type:complete